MSDETVVRLVSVLERLERETPHAPGCPASDPMMPRSCFCQRGERLRLAIAQRTEAAMKKVWLQTQRTDSSHHWDDVFDAGVAAFASPVRDQESPQ
jgi:hypothetical protein